jgi:hypothetical protein
MKIRLLVLHDQPIKIQMMMMMMEMMMMMQEHQQKRKHLNHHQLQVNQYQY